MQSYPLKNLFLPHYSNNLKLVSSIFYILLKGSISKIMKNVFYFMKKAIFFLQLPHSKGQMKLE